MIREHGGLQCGFQKGRQFEGTGIFFDLKWSKKIF